MDPDRRYEDVLGELEYFKQEAEQLDRDVTFYYDKLRAIEDLCNESEKTPFVESVLSILWATAEGFKPMQEMVSSGETY